MDRNMPDSQISVSELNQQVKMLLEYSFAEVTVFGEISGFAKYQRSGHWYFTLKDAQAQVQCAMFAGNNAKCSMRPADGDQVLVRARVSLYSPRGNYQLICQSMQPLGQGQLMQRFLQLKQKLLQEGLFAPERKKPVPDPLALGHLAIVTSHQGAAVHDILKVLAERMPAIKVSVVDTQVQGSAAVAQIIPALRYADSLGADVLLLTRGGGALEDLWCFNDESLVRALAACRSFTMSAIGHETDQSLCDFAADAQAPTPSAAAAILSSQAQQLLASVHQRQNFLQRLMRARLDENWQRLDYWHQRLRASNPRSQISTQLGLLANRHQRLRQGMQQTLDRHRHQLELLFNKLNSLNPNSVLQRGYALVYSEQGKVLRHSAETQPQAQIRVQLAQGKLSATVNQCLE